ncbi:Glycoprotein 120 [Caenorhabditis elegans]|uniref:Glycoprotein 120 n=1 Tax=Caenorhabditis elegans TaxID=6239 RepID=O01469_CAEEL|nr:Glycoprotein 120 [Caenorhabditis elegans]CCD62892.1 Glycoprotein 120 [Caenorhabditis elegans]|eukprot:NP_504539.2 Uncharacterized protein CELE_C04E6.4 [Caenorhabditis elegans]
MNVCNCLLLIVIFQSAFKESKSKNFIEIKISFDKNQCNTKNVWDSLFSNGSNHPAAIWMNSWSEEEARTMKCEIKSTMVTCYCVQNEAFWDFSEIMSTVYTISRDKCVGSVKTETFDQAGNSNLGLKNIKCTLDALYKNAMRSSNMLQYVPQKSHNVWSCPLPQKNLTEKLNRPKNRGDVDWRIAYSNNGYCFNYFAYGSNDLFTQPTKFLMVKDKLLEQINAKKALYTCDKKTEAYCNYRNVLKHLPGQLMKISTLEVEHVSALCKLNYSKTSEYFLWISFENAVRGSRGAIIMGPIAGVLVFGTIFICWTSLSYELIEERKPLDPQTFKLKDIEFELKKAMSDKLPERGSSTIQAAVDLEKVKLVDRKRQRRHRSIVYPSSNLRD